MDLTADQVRFDRDLGTASVRDVPVTIISTEFGPDGGYQESSRPVTVSLTFIGVGAVT